MLVSHTYSIVLFTLERTASTSIHSALEKYFDISINESSLDVNLKHIPVSTFKYIIEPFLLRPYYKVTIFRDPIDRCISLYKSDYSKMSFSEWWKCNKAPWLSQVNQLSVNGNLYVDRLFDFNKFNTFFMFMSQIFGSFIKVPKIGSTSKLLVDIPNNILDDMKLYLKEDIILYKSIIDAGGELIINRYHSTP